MKKEFGFLGVFRTENGMLFVCDPASSPTETTGTACLKCAEGNWVAFAYSVFNESGGRFIAELSVYHETLFSRWPPALPYPPGVPWGEPEFSIVVDSGIAGVFCIEPGLQGREWYVETVKKALGSGLAGLCEGGAVASSGYGDGIYPVYLARTGKNITAIKLEFLEIASCL